MSARHLVEPATDLIVDYLKANFATALADVRNSRNAQGNLGLATPVPAPENYFIAKNYTPLNPPAIFVVCDSVDFKKDRGANHINATAKYGIVAISEAQTTKDVTRITWRYQAALSQLLDNLTLNSADSELKIHIIVRNAEFSEEYDPSENEGNPAKRWRKGVMLKCDVEFYEEL